MLYYISFNVRVYAYFVSAHLMFGFASVVPFFFASVLSNLKWFCSIGSTSLGGHPLRLPAMGVGCSREVLSLNT
jgi:hypothetical protein